MVTPYTRVSWSGSRGKFLKYHLKMLKSRSSVAAAVEVGPVLVQNVALAPGSVVLYSVHLVHSSRCG